MEDTSLRALYSIESLQGTVIIPQHMFLIMPRECVEASKTLSALDRIFKDNNKQPVKREA